MGVRFFIMVLGLSCICCGSTRKAVTEDRHSVGVAVVDSMAASSSVQSLLTDISEKESLHVVIEEFGGNWQADSNGGASSAGGASSTGSASGNITRRITIDRNRQREEQGSSQTQVRDSVNVSKTDSTTTDSHREAEQDIAVNSPQWGFSEGMLLFFLLFVLAVIIREYLYKRKEF